MRRLLKRLWRDHSRTIVGLALGSVGCIASDLYWPDGGNHFDIATIVAGAILALGLQGVLDACTRETARPED